MKWIQQSLLLALADRAVAYTITAVGDIGLTDDETGLSGLVTIFKEEPTTVTVSGLEWDDADTSVTSLMYETFYNDKSAATGTIELEAGDLPDSVDAGSILVGDRGTVTIRVVLTSGESEEETSSDYQSFRKGVALIPLLVVLGFAVTTRLVCTIIPKFSRAIFWIFFIW
jgi:hypothetical protein